MKKGYLIKLRSKYCTHCRMCVEVSIRTGKKEKKKACQEWDSNPRPYLWTRTLLVGGSKVGAATTQSDRTCRQAGIRLSLCQSAALTEHRAEACTGGG